MAEWVTRLSESLLLAGHDLGGQASVSLGRDGNATPVTARAWNSASGTTQVLSIPVPADDDPAGVSLGLEVDGDTTVHDLAELDDLHTVTRRALAPLEAMERAEVTAFLASTVGEVPRSEQYELCERLARVREALRERLPHAVVAQNQPIGLHIDRILAVDDRSFYLEGWLHDEDSQVCRLTAVSPEGARAELRGRKFRFAREDVSQFFGPNGQQPRTKHGFLCFVELDAPSLLPGGWLFELETHSGMAMEVQAPQVVSDSIAVRTEILEDPFLDRLPDDELMEGHVYPAISRIQVQITGDVTIDKVTQFESPPDAPDVSIVVPLYRQIDHLEAQLAEFADDPEIAGADLIYVLDSPEQAEQLLQYAAQLAPLYRVPFRVAILDRNIGFAGANNAGASLARGRLLLLMNSDVLPSAPGWLSRLRDFYDATPDIGALGPKLLYEDDSIQHAGMYYYQPPGSTIWQDAHYYKGLHRTLPAANETRSVPMLSGACMMIDAALYQQLGGLSGIYVQGDYEDSQLCLQLAELERRNWYFPEVELYHLEAQSYSPEVRRASNRYNAWLHTHLWRSRIEAVMGDAAPA